MIVVNTVAAAVLGTIAFLVICAVITLSVLWMFNYAQRIPDD